MLARFPTALEAELGVRSRFVPTLLYTQIFRVVAWTLPLSSFNRFSSNVGLFLVIFMGSEELCK